MSGWFPRLNRNGDVVSGDGVVFANGVNRGPGNRPVWNGPSSVVASGLPGSVLIDTATGARVDVAEGFNELSAEQRTGQWAGWRPGDDRQGFAAFYRGGETEPWTTAAGITAPQYSDLGSHLAYINPYQASTRNLICDNRPIASGPIMQVSVCESAIVWLVATGVYTRAVFGARFGADNLPGASESLGILDWEEPQVFDTPEGPWVLSVTQDPGVMLRPFGSNRGHRLVGLFYYPHVAFVQGVIRIVSTDAHGTPQSTDLALTDPRVLLEPTTPPVIPPKPPDTPVIPPVIPPTKKDPMQLTARQQDIVQQLHDKHPEWADAHGDGEDDQRRKLAKAIAQQFRFEFGEQWGWKSNHGNTENDAPSKDAIAHRSGPFVQGRQDLDIFDLFNGGTRQPNNPCFSETENRDQYFVPVEPVNHLAQVVDPPKPPDEPTPDLAQVLTRLAALDKRVTGVSTSTGASIASLKARVGRLEKKARVARMA